ncbi:cytoskeletal protein RodZ [Paraburkholderia sp. GAS199]|uniref:hypothetical protein n=1 Tax=Paraburkholderia sp. GAS199 TaxID=3035126 RepID=UPI003D1DDCD9
MVFKTYTVLTLLVFSSAALAWQPLTYPVRSQSAYQRSVDTALCYAAASKQTKVNIARESQLPPRKPAATKTSSTGTPSRPPLPPSSFSATPTGGASMPVAATAAGASAPAATDATGKPGKPGTKTATATAASSPTTSAAASATTADIGASGTVAASDAQTTAGSDVKLPPLPAPEPPMTQYWAAYGACMQSRGYVVTQ